MAALLEKIAYGIYDMAWQAAIPFLSKNKRLAEGLDQRKVLRPLPESDVWIQAASAGESYLVQSILQRFKPSKPVRILVTSNTSQGMDILDETIRDPALETNGLRVESAYFPFDRPTIMKRAFSSVKPKVLVLLESEIWPGLLRTARRFGTKIIIINGRINEKSVKHYQLYPSIWKNLAPDRVFAISDEDARRFSILFGKQRVSIMPNIKFDRIGISTISTPVIERIKTFLPDGSPFLVLASVREQEEPFVRQMIPYLLSRLPNMVIGLFPRHMHRVSYWIQELSQSRAKWYSRSSMNGPVEPGSIILWDKFGELGAAYYPAHAAFVGGSLAPLGGQNFLEPLMCGVVPVTGPSWHNFHWIGREIFDTGLVKMANDWKESADMLLARMMEKPSRLEILAAAEAFIEKRRGGAGLACQVIGKYLE